MRLRDYINKAIDVIKSCETQQQIAVCHRYLMFLHKRLDLPTIDEGLLYDKYDSLDVYGDLDDLLFSKFEIILIKERLERSEKCQP